MLAKEQYMAEVTEEMIWFRKPKYGQISGRSNVALAQGKQFVAVNGAGM